MSPVSSGVRSDAKGRHYEIVAMCFLWLHGYRILARRFRTRCGEIDLVARRGSVVSFVEVKARAEGAGIAVPSARQRERISRASIIFLARYPKQRDWIVRFDVLSFHGWRWPLHQTNAWHFHSGRTWT